ncbi:MAG TPA: hypothetical protein VGG62_06215 [Terracidiphilus sp.]|jgi:hypothetical protein
MPKVVLTRREEEENLKALVAMLNDLRGPAHDWKGKSYGYDDTVKLRRLIHAWKEMMKANKGRQSIDKMNLSTEDRADLERFAKGIQAYFKPDGSLAIVDYYPHPPDEAAFQFTRFLLNSQQGRLGGPCPGIRKRKECGRWFDKRDPKQEFHDHRCAATARQARKRQSDHDQKIKQVKQAIRNYLRRPARFRDMDWKSYVEEATGISKRFLTKAIQQGELSEPKGARYAKG